MPVENLVFCYLKIFTRTFQKSEKPYATILTWKIANCFILGEDKTLHFDILTWTTTRLDASRHWDDNTGASGLSGESKHIPRRVKKRRGIWRAGRQREHPSSRCQQQQHQRQRPLREKLIISARERLAKSGITPTSRRVDSLTLPASKLSDARTPSGRVNSRHCDS